VVAKEQSSEPAAPPTGAEMAAREWMQGVGKIWCNTPNNLPKGIVKSLEDASFEFEFVSTPEGLRFVEGKAGKLEEYIRATSQAKSNIALNKILNEICPQKLTAFTRQRVRQLREEGIDKIRIDLYCLGEISNCSLIITLFIFLYSTIERIVRQRVRACSTERQPKSKHRQCCSNGKSPARHWIDFSPLMMPHPHPGHHPAWSYQVGNR